MQEGKVVVWEGFINSWGKKKSKGKGERERHAQLDAEFQKTGRKEKKAFLRVRWKEIEENSRVGKTGELFKKIGDTKGIFHAKMGAIKDRRGKDIAEVEEIKMRWQEYTEELHKKRS